MTWMVSADTRRLVKTAQLELARQVHKALRRTGYTRAILASLQLARRGESLEVYTMDQVVALGEVLYANGVSYELFKKERVDVDEVRAGALVSA